MKSLRLLSCVIACGLVAVAFSVHAQKTSLSPVTPTKENRIRLMTSENQITAFFYKKPVVLDKEQHKGLRLKAADARFAAKNQSVPVVLAEFPEASLEYPIVFAKSQDSQWIALALTGLQADSNAFVDESGRWTGRYVPASVRRYPFILAEGENKQLSLAVDMDAPQLGGEGEALFDDKGEPTELVRNVMNMMGEFQSQALSTGTLAKELDDAKLLTQQSLRVQLGDGRNAVVDGVWIVDEAKLRELSDDKILSLYKSGALVAIHAHMLSLRNLLPLLERSQPAAADAKADKKPSNNRKDKS
jgi:hypothetical protein